MAGNVNKGFGCGNVAWEALRWINPFLLDLLVSSGDVETLDRSSVEGDTNWSVFLIELLLVAELNGTGKAIADNETSRKCFNESCVRLSSEWTVSS